MTTPFPFVSGAVLTAAQLNAITTLPISAKTASYTLVVGDLGKRIQMTNASATTITVNTGIFAAGDSVFIYNAGAGTCTVTAGTATVTTSGSLALAQYGGGTLLFTSASAATFFSGAGSSYGTATGGSSSSITVDGIAYTLLTFTTDSNLVVTKAGLFDVLLVGGGGGGGKNSGGGGGGGGGTGQLVQASMYLTAATHLVDVGAGGAFISVGSPSKIGATYPDAISANGGGNGASGAASVREAMCGGGSGMNSPVVFTSLAGFGQFGGGIGFAGGDFGGGGGGGTSAAGNAGTTSVGGVGGAGTDIGTYLGAGATLVGGGGGGSNGSNATGSAGGTGGGGASGSTPVAGTANTGSGGGAGANGTNGAAGGSGVVYVRFKS
jgi:hypothetical protein